MKNGACKPTKNLQIQLLYNNGPVNATNKVKIDVSSSHWSIYKYQISLFKPQQSSVY